MADAPEVGGVDQAVEDRLTAPDPWNQMSLDLRTREVERGIVAHEMKKALDAGDAALAARMDSKLRCLSHLYADALADYAAYLGRVALRERGQLAAGPQGESGGEGDPPPPPPAEPDRLHVMAQNLANLWGEEVFVIDRTSPGLEYERQMPYAVLASRADAWEKDPANRREAVGPEKKEGVDQ